MADPMSEPRLQKLWELSLGPAESWGTLSAGATFKPTRPEAEGDTPLAAQTLSAMGTLGAGGTLSGQATVSPGGPTTVPRPAGMLAEGEFELVEELGRGGMGVVYRARQTALRREVAIKTLRPDQAGAAPEKFVAEALVTGVLDHPNIVPVHDLGRAPDGQVYLAMKLVGGTAWDKLLHPETEEQRLRARGLTLADHLTTLLAVCNAVAFAHTRGVLHRDLKPENVMVGEFGEVLVMDWGIAVDIRETPASDSRAPHKSTICGPAGTPSYMAPEMAEGQGAKLGPWTDVYLLGAILHELLTGRPPHTGATLMGVLLAAARAEPPELGPEVPAPLQEICRRAMAREPAQRYPTVGAFQQALEDYQQHRESLLISERAEAELAELSGPGAAGSTTASEDRNQTYARYAKVVARFEQALELWSGNAPARTGARRARLAYAGAALAAGDFGLAEAQVTPLEADEEARTRLAEIRSAAAARARKERNGRLLRGAVALLLLLVAGGLAVGIAIVRDERAVAESERDLARAARAKAAEERDRAKAAEQRASAERDKALRAREEAAEQRDKAIKAEAATAAARDEAKAERDKAVEAEKLARAETTKARIEAWKGRMAAARAQFHRALMLARTGHLAEAAARALHSAWTAHPNHRPAETRDDPGLAPSLAGWHLFSVLSPLLSQPGGEVRSTTTITASTLTPDGKAALVALDPAFGRGQVIRVQACALDRRRRREVFLARLTKKPKIDGSIDALAFTSDGKYLVATARTQQYAAPGRPRSGHLCVWDSATGKLVRTEPVTLERGRGGSGIALAAHPTRSYVAVAPEGGPIRLWDPGSGKLAGKLGVGAYLGLGRGYLRFRPDGARLASLFNDTLTIFDIASKMAIKRFKLPRTGRGLAWAPDGQSLLYVTWSGQVVRIKANGGAIIWRSEEAADFVPDAIAVRAGVVLVLGGRSVPLLHLSSGRRFDTLPPFREATTSVTLDRSDSRSLLIASPGEVRRVRLANLPTALVEVPHEPDTKKYYKPKFALDTTDGAVAIQPPVGADPIQLYTGHRPRGVTVAAGARGDGRVQGNIDRLDDHRVLLMTSHKRLPDKLIYPATLLTVDARNGKILRELSISRRPEFAAAVMLIGRIDERRALCRVNRVETKPEKPLKSVRSDNRYFHLLDLETGELGPRILHFTEGTIADVRVVPGTESFVIRNRSIVRGRSFLSVYSLAGKLLRRAKYVVKGRTVGFWPHSAMTLTRSGRLILTSDGRTQVFDTKTLSELRLDEDAGAFAISRDGHFAITGGSSVRLADVGTGSLIRTLDVGGTVTEAFMISGSHALIRCQDRRRFIWHWRNPVSETVPISFEAFKRRIGAAVVTSGPRAGEITAYNPP